MTVYSMAYATQLVSAGVQWANDTWGPEWVWDIDLDRLDIGDGEYCILGQMYAEQSVVHDSGDGWHHAMEYGVVAWDRTYGLGLSVRYDHNHPEVNVTNVRSINAAWRAQIRHLRKTVPQPIA